MDKAKCRELNLTGGITGGLGERYVSNNAHLIRKEDYSIGGIAQWQRNHPDEASVSFDAVHGAGRLRAIKHRYLTLAWGATDEYCGLVVSGEAKLTAD